MEDDEDIGPQENKPGDSKFRQQKLPASKPVLTCRCVVPLFLAFGIVFIPLGSVLLLASTGVKELVLDYTKCAPLTTIELPEGVFFGEEGCANLRKLQAENATTVPCVCQVNFTLTEDWNSEVFGYYRLTQYFQNHRRYVRSINNEQLRGVLSTTSDCSPFSSSNSRPIAPCGMVANSFFNDTFSLAYANGSNIAWSRRNIAWTEDRDNKFRNPSGNLTVAFSEFSKPVYWQRQASELDPSDPSNNGLVNEDFLVWMRTSALPKFRKLYSRNPNGLKKGSYILTVEYNYPISHGQKNFVLSTASWMGGKNHFLGIAYITVGCTALLTGGFLAIVNQKYGKRKVNLADTQ